MEREILNHRLLRHPHIIQFKEVSRFSREVLPHSIAVLSYVASECSPATHCPLDRPLPQIFLTPQYLGIAMEYAPGGDMFEYVVKKNGLREDEARWFFQQLIVCLDYIHRMVRSTAQSAWCCWWAAAHRALTGILASAHDAAGDAPRD